MITAKSHVLVFQDIEQVYRFVALDFVANYPRWSPEVISLKALSDGPIQPGYQASQVRVDSIKFPDSALVIVAVTETITSLPSQISVAVGWPKSQGTPHSTIRFGTQVITGGVVSCTVMV